jgi:hypothetical protein
MEIPRYALLAVAAGVLIAAGWASTRSHPSIALDQDCGPLVEDLRREPSSATRALASACLGLRGDATGARSALGGDRVAARMAFDLVHHIADDGDDARTFEVMALVVEADPDHYQALYHAGIGARQLGRDVIARAYLERFLSIYPADDGFTRNARAVLDALP